MFGRFRKQKQQGGSGVSGGGNLYSWGRGKQMVLGHGDDVTRKTPAAVSAFADDNLAQVCCFAGVMKRREIVQIASFSSHVLAIDTQGRAYCMLKT